MKKRREIVRLMRSSERFFSPFVALIVVLVALNAQAQRPYLFASPNDVNVGKRSPGTAYSARVFVQAINGSIFVNVKDDAAGPNSVNNISPSDSLTIAKNQIVEFVITGDVPSTPGLFQDTIEFDPSDTALSSVYLRITGESSTAAPPPPPPPPPASYWVGIIPGSGSCPANSSLITVHMDDQDVGNRSDWAGWIGAITSDRNTTFRFCRVDGRHFYPLAETNSVTNHYAVLKLGSTCPNGSHYFERTFDNEDNRNQNWKGTSSGDAAELVTIDVSNSDSVSETKLPFCLFKAGASTMSAFPPLGIEYGVFAAWDFSKAIQTGWVYTDDEDTDNHNRFGGDTDGKRIIAPMGDTGRDTGLGTAKVRCLTPDCAVCGDSICSPSEDATSCPYDCGVCGDGTCGAGEDSWSCPADCDSCGDQLCGPGENSFSCPVDCSNTCGNGVCELEDQFNCPGGGC